MIWARKFTGNIPKGVVVKAFYNGNLLGGFYVTIQTGRANTGSALLKLDANGITLFQRNMISTSSIKNINFFDMQVTSDGGCIITGEEVDVFTGNPILVKFSSTGVVSFARVYFFDVTFRFAEGLSVAITPTGFAVGGRTDVSSLIVNNLVFTTNSNGLFLWARSYTSTAISLMRTDNIIAEPSGNIIFGGNGFNSSVPAFQVKLNSVGAVLHSFRYYSAAAVSDLKISPLGYIMAGTSDFGTAAEDFYVLQTNSLGNTGSGCPRTNLPVIIDSLDTTFVVGLSHTINSSAQVNVAATVATPNISTVESRCGTFLSAAEYLQPLPEMQVIAIPGQEIVSIQLKGVDFKAGEYTIGVYGPEGQLRFVKKMLTLTADFAIPKYVPGFYSFVLMQNQQKILTKKQIL